MKGSLFLIALLALATVAVSRSLTGLCGDGKIQREKDYTNLKLENYCKLFILIIAILVTIYVLICLFFISELCF